jgi:putative two-component system response regulator
MKNVVVLDDQYLSLVKIEEALENHFNVLTATNAQNFFMLIRKVKPDLILLDIEMPETSGFDICRQLKKSSEKYSKVPVIFLTAKMEPEVEELGFNLGAVDFITKPFSNQRLLNHIKTHINIDALIRKRTETLKQREREIRNIRNGITSVLSDLIESRDEITGGHIARTADYTRILIEGLLEKGFYTEDIQDWVISSMSISASLHDVGKITISDTILNKPGKLTDDEFSEIKRHTLEGERIIERIIEKTGIKGGFLQNAKLFAGQHHEKWNGMGYPRGLREQEISLQGRIMAIADVYDALVSNRPYKKAFSHEKAVEIIMSESGKHFDPKLTELFWEIKDKFLEVRENNG